MIERISLFIKTLNISVNAFEQKIGASNGLIRKAVANKTDIQSKWIIVIAENYPLLNIRWLLTGEGEMLLDNSTITLEPTSSNDFLKDQIISLQRDKIKTLEEKLAQYEISNLDDARLDDTAIVVKQSIHTIPKRATKEKN